MNTTIWTLHLTEAFRSSFRRNEHLCQLWKASEQSDTTGSGMAGDALNFSGHGSQSNFDFSSWGMSMGVWWQAEEWGEMYISSE